MTGKSRPIPPENRSDKGPGGAASAGLDQDQHGQERTRNLAEQGRQGNIKQNTTNQGYQQDR
jgi:hypothetical protein